MVATQLVEAPGGGGATQQVAKRDWQLNTGLSGWPALPAETGQACCFGLSLAVRGLSQQKVGQTCRRHTRMGSRLPNLDRAAGIYYACWSQDQYQNLGYSLSLGCRNARTIWRWGLTDSRNERCISSSAILAARSWSRA
jgi:hypothetical protein